MPNTDPSGRPTIDPERASERLQRLVERTAGRRRVPHVVLGVATGDGSFHWTGASGPADASGTPLTADSPYFIASVTKLYIAATILLLAEQGDIDLDEPMLTYLGEDRVGGIHRIGDVDHTPEITIRHLLGHTSGLPDYLEDKPAGATNLYRQLSAGEDHGWDLDEVIRIVRDDMTPKFSPRTLGDKPVRARYSDTNYQLLIAVIEAVRNAGVDRVFDELLFQPLGLNQTYMPGRSEPRDPSDAPTAAVWSKGQALGIPLAMASFNDLYSTADDTLRFARALTGGEVFADPATYGSMSERTNPIFYPIQYGLGMMQYRVGRLFAPVPRAVTLSGHSGATGSWLFHSPDLDVVVTGTVDDAKSRRRPFRLLPKVLRAVFK